MAGPSPLNSACNCCSRPPTTSLVLEFVSRNQTCRGSGCGFSPCTSTGDTICDPDAGSMSQQDKCANKRYLTRTSNGTDGKVSTTTCTATPQGGCDCKTTCSGSQITKASGFGSITENTTIIYPPYAKVKTTCDGSLESETTKTYNEDCSTSSSKCIGSGKSSLSITYDPYLSGGSWSGIRIFSEKCSASLNQNCEWNGTYTRTGYNSNIDYQHFFETGEWKVVGDFTVSWSTGGKPCCGVPYLKTEVTPSGGKTTINYSNVNTVKICTPQSLPSFPEFTECGKTQPPLSSGQGRSGEAYRFTSPTDQRETSQQDFKFRLKHEPTGTCYLKVWFVKEVQNYRQSSATCPALEEDGDPTKEDMGEPYEWEGSGYPCFKDKSKQPSECENAIYSDPQTVTGQENQSVIVRIKKWSIVKGYEPDDPDENGCQGCRPNGFPIPDPADCPTCE